jgi:DNA-directed RNA polymerase II subunit RPB2
VSVSLFKITYERNPKTGKEIEHEDRIESWQKVPIGKIPVMVRSNFCHLSNLKKSQIVEQGECNYDQGGYFVINGSEKVLVAQERMATNIVLVFNKKPPCRFSWVGEIRSQAEGAGRPPQQFRLQLLSKVKSDSKGQTI